MVDLSPNRILEIIGEYEPLTQPPLDMRRAAVLVPLRPAPGDPDSLELLLTRRSQELPTHAGQVSFPGGMMDPGDETPEATALRETHEELGIEPDSVRLVGRLDHVITITQFHVVPVVGLLPSDVTLTPSPREVARAFFVPMGAVLSADAWEQRDHQYRGNEFRIWHLPYDGEDIWGVTGHMLRALVEMLWSRAS